MLAAELARVRHGRTNIDSNPPPTPCSQSSQISNLMAQSKSNKKKPTMNQKGFVMGSLRYRP